MKDPRAFIIFPLVFAFSLSLPGCGGSKEAEEETAPPAPSATELIQKEIITLKAENESLKKQVAKLEGDNRSATARIADLETQLAETKAKEEKPPSLPAVGTPTETYKEALNLFRSGNYQAASQLFHVLVESNIPERLQDNCHYWMGECAYGEKEYAAAIKHFEEVFTFPISEKKDESQLMIANCYNAMGNKAKAKEEYEKLLVKFPASPYAKRVKEKLEKLQ